MNHTTLASITHQGNKLQDFFTSDIENRLMSVYIESPYISQPYFAEYNTRGTLRFDNVVEYDSSYDISVYILGNRYVYVFMFLYVLLCVVLLNYVCCVFIFIICLFDVNLC
jgi:hypothetical protein